ncbi:MAG TPA: hypothetical protein IAD24_01565 [Candidatus Aphodomorpha intestinavium]|uniref:Uncharacterized protein n=1 Tax=Candidatus Aphodomorpha intestinavium TaxID=2840672 RepID=A0A9D1ST36_9FIRM|nr:hypothetical protein [Candidatus Aphodomorpha intestinavium]
MFNLVKRAAVCLSALLLLALFTLPGRYLTRFSAEMEAGFAAVEEAAAAGDTALARRAAESLHARAPEAARVLRLFISHDVVDEMALCVLLVDPDADAASLAAALTSARAAVAHLCAIELFEWETLL